MVLRLLNFVIISGVLPGLALIFFPKLVHHYLSFDSEIPYNKKDAWKYRLGGFIIILISIAFLIFHNWSLR